MCGEIALRDVPTDLIERFALLEYVTTRGEADVPELRFAFRHPKPRLPVRIDGELTIVEWGNRDNRLSRLPKTGWCRQDSLDAGKWRHLRPEPVTIPAHFGREKGVWFPIREGLEGVLVRDERDGPHCYMLTTDASVAYEAMTGHERMPVLIGQTI